MIAKDFKPTEHDLIRIKTMSETGLPLPNIAASYGMCEDTFRKLCKKIPALDKAVKDGWNAGNEFLCGKLWQGVRENNMTSIIFALKIRLRMSDRMGNPISEKQELNQLVKINFKAMTPTEAARTYQQIMRGEK